MLLLKVELVSPIYQFGNRLNSIENGIIGLIKSNNPIIFILYSMSSF